MATGTVTLSTALAEILPVADSPLNEHMSDVIGNKDDTIAGNSSIALLKQALAAIAEVDINVELTEEHFHSAAKCYPTLTDGIPIIGGAGVWALGLATQIVPINTILVKFDIHYIEVEVATANDIYELVLYSDALCTVEIGRARTSKQSNQTGATSMPFQTPVIAANSGIWAKLASKTGGDTLTISVFYHTYE